MAKLLSALYELQDKHEAFRDHKTIYKIIDKCTYSLANIKTVQSMDLIVYCL